MARVKLERNYAKDRQMYQCEKDDKEICKNCVHWKYDPELPSLPIKTCLLNMDSISSYMSCDNFKQA